MFSAVVQVVGSSADEATFLLVAEFEVSKQVLNVALSGDLDEHSLRRLAERVRDEILGLPGISVVRLGNARPFEISIEVSEAALRRWSLSFDDVVAAVRRSSNAADSARTALARPDHGPGQQSSGS